MDNLSKIHQWRKTIESQCVVPHFCTPEWVSEKQVFEYSTVSVEVVAYLKAVRAVQSLKSLRLLQANGLIIDFYTIGRGILMVPPKYPDPYRLNNYFDACAFNPGDQLEFSASEKLFRLYERDGLPIILMSKSVKNEIAHKNTPSWVKSLASRQLYSRNFSLTDDELLVKEEILKVLTGNGKREKHEKDTEHILRAKKEGGVYFITVDRGILRKARDLRNICGIVVLLPSEFLELLDEWKIYTKQAEGS
ncbi:hypothetical protein PJI16_01420 [Nitrospira sp. MA-1]|nr:hypothetical protein [Nitrospira sp. MA-1]